jgi:hypothetical protein
VPITCTLVSGTAVTRALVTWVEDTRKAQAAMPPRPPKKPDPVPPMPQPGPEGPTQEYQRKLAEWEQAKRLYPMTQEYQQKLAEWKQALADYEEYKKTQQARVDEARWEQLKRLALRDLDLAVHTPSSTGETVATTYHVKRAKLKLLLPEGAQVGKGTVEKLIFVSPEIELPA